MAQNEQNWDRENADDQLNEQVTPWSQRAFADDAVEDPAGESAAESVEESARDFSEDLVGDFDDDSSILPGYTPVWRVLPRVR